MLVCLWAVEPAEAQPRDHTPPVNDTGAPPLPAKKKKAKKNKKKRGKKAKKAKKQKVEQPKPPEEEPSIDAVETPVDMPDSTPAEAPVEAPAEPEPAPVDLQSTDVDDVPIEPAEPELTPSEQFAKGLKEYDAGNFEVSRDLFRKSYDREPDPRKLYALGQAERYSGNCRAAVKVYDEALSGDLSDGAKKVVTEARNDCQLVLDEAAKISAEEVARRLEESRANRAPARIIVIDNVKQRAWYKDPVAGIITATGVVALGVGGTFLWLGDKEAKKALDAQTFDEFEEHYDKQDQFRLVGLVSAIAGGTLVVAGTTWYLVRAAKGKKVRRTEKNVEVTSYATPTGGGFVIFGRF
jgi:hypothetical protein